MGRLNGDVDETNWGGRIRTCNFPGNSRAVCQLTYTPIDEPTPGDDAPAEGDPAGMSISIGR